MYSVTLASNLFFTGQQFFNKKAAGSSNLLPFFCIQNFSGFRHLFQIKSFYSFSPLNFEPG